MAELLLLLFSVLVTALGDTGGKAARRLRPRLSPVAVGIGAALALCCQKWEGLWWFCESFRNHKQGFDGFIGRAGLESARCFSKTCRGFWALSEMLWGCSLLSAKGEFLKTFCLGTVWASWIPQFKMTVEKWELAPQPWRFSHKTCVNAWEAEEQSLVI